MMESRKGQGRREGRRERGGGGGKRKNTAQQACFGGSMWFLGMEYF